MSIRRIDPDQARREIAATDALLVCAYDDSAKCQEYHLESAVSLAELKAREGELRKDRTLLFYCA